MRPPSRYFEVAGSLTRDLVAWHGGRPSSVDTYIALRAAHRATGGWSSSVARAALARVPRAVDRVPRRRLPPLDPGSSRALHELRRDGLASADPILDDADIRSLVAFARSAPGQLRMTDGTRARGSHDDRPHGAAALFLDGTFTWARPEVQRVMADERLLALVTSAVGMRPVVHPPQLYWSFPIGDADETQIGRALARSFHWDYDGIGGVRLHIYLTDVDGGAGPMEYVTGSHRRGALGWHPPGAVDQAISDEALAERFPRHHWRTMIGSAGTTFLSNPHGLHRATRPTARERLFMVLPIQAGGFGGYYIRRRAVPVRDRRFGDALACGRPELRLFRAGEPGSVAASLAGDIGPSRRR